ncbi:MAG TPA: YitT family protein [Anaerolineae bacterium]|nr:YitT family protein [Anaerolineae bacterium]
MADSAPEIRGCAPAMSSPGGAMEVKPDSEQFKIKKCVSRRRILALVVTKDPQAVSEKIIKEMKRSGTLLSGQGIYSHQDHPVLMVALTVTEVAHLKAIVRAQDPQAFVVVISAQEVLGGSFQPLKEEK